MRIPFFSWLSLIPFFLILFGSLDVLFVSGQCLKDQQALLLQLKGSLKFDNITSTRLMTWDKNKDCCGWNGVGCDASGRVVSLELDGESISGGIENSTSLFSLRYLERLNLALNSFNSVPIPSGISNLKNLVYMNLSNAGFVGQIPNELTNLEKLVVLDLSNMFPGLQPLRLENPNLKALIQNLTSLEELYLDGVDISAQKSEWCQVLASSLPNLAVLSLRRCGISGPIDKSLLELRSLSVVQLDANNLSTTVPDFFADFSNLRTLSLSYCNLLGTFPGKIFQVSTLQVLDLSGNELLWGSLPQFPPNGSLREIVLRYTNFSGSIPGSISNLLNLSRIELTSCSFSGSIPPVMENLSSLVYLDFSSNKFNGSIPSFGKLKNLSHIDLFDNSLSGPLYPTHFAQLSNLENLYLGFNSLNGSIPSYLFGLPSLRKLELQNNQFSGQVDEFPNASSSLLGALDLSANHLNGSIPKSFFDLKELSVLSLSSNFFTGTIQLEFIKNLHNLTRLELSYNKISVAQGSDTSNSSTLPQLSVLKLASCKLQVFPNLANQSRMILLDLSDNQIEGEIPNWIWQIGNETLLHLNLSSNRLVSLQQPFNFPDLMVLDLHSNQLQGEIPIPPASVMYVDYSSNNFNHSIPTDIGNYIYSSFFFSLSNNRLTGSIPESLCKAYNLLVLDLSNNALTGKIPSCLVEKIGLGVLNLARNNFTGIIPDTFPINCNLKTLDLNSNALEGNIPRTLINCANLDVLNIGNNIIEDIFPCGLQKLPKLRVLVLRSNNLHGGITCAESNSSWSEIQIIDMAFNNFSGILTPESFSIFKRMKYDYNAQLASGDLRFNYLDLSHFYYQDRVTVTMKGLEMELVKILTVFTSIDFSSNKLFGEIPSTIGDLKFLYILNLSHNAFTGRIPSSIGNLTNLGSLDLSKNQLSGEIPATIEKITFLSFLNLSFNELSGMIPKGNQFQTFTNASYEGNARLCGYPLSTTCNGLTGNELSPSLVNMPSRPKTEIKWEYVSAAAGYIAGLGTFILSLLFCRNWRDHYFHHVNRLFEIMGRSSH